MSYKFDIIILNNYQILCCLGIQTGQKHGLSKLLSKQGGSFPAYEIFYEQILQSKYHSLDFFPV